MTYNHTVGRGGDLGDESLMKILNLPQTDFTASSKGNNRASSGNDDTVTMTTCSSAQFVIKKHSMKVSDLDKSVLSLCCSYI